MAKIHKILPIFLIASSYFLQFCCAQDDYQKKAETLHNEYRKKHHVSDIKLDTDLNALAVQCAEYYAKNKKIDHTCPYKKTAGENLFGGQGPWSNVESAGVASKTWYDEVKDYDYKKATFAGNTGHFTQVVWKGSKKLGFGVAKVDGYTAAVGLYEPGGNIMEHFKENVAKP